MVLLCENIMAHHRLVYFALLLFCQFVVHSTFNLDDKHSVVYSGSPGEYFGYAVTFHAQSSGKNWVVVGAPLGNMTSPSTERNRYGSVYKCNSDRPSCEVIAIDDRIPETRAWDGQQVDIEEMTGQWLGATVASSSSNGELLACAPRYTLWGTVVDKPENRDRQLLGKCFVVRNDLLAVRQVLQPCYHDNDGKNLNYEPAQDGTCQAGLSGATSSDGKTFLIGLPGRYFVDGSIALYYSDDLNKPYKTPSVKPIEDPVGHLTGMAMGYAVAIGRFSSRDRDELIASSTRASQLKGKVMAFYPLGKDDVKVRFSLPLPQDVEIGSNFGYSLCAVDLNNDRYSDLLVSAPYHGQDEGRVYVYINNGKTPGTLNHVPALTLEGPRTKHALFGFAMAVAGDLNQDEYPDVAISAPYAGHNQGGVVYIFFGSKYGIETSPRQVIQASEVSPGVKTFGYSLAGDMDMDNNGYPDLAVGAYSSDKAFLFRSRSIVIMEGNIALNNTQISLEDNGTVRKASDGISRISIDLTVCLRFKNQKPRQSSELQNVTYTIELDKSRSEDSLQRMFFVQDKKTLFKIVQQVSLPQEQEWYCDFNHTVYLRKKEEIRSVSDPLTFDLVYDLAQPSSCELCPILNDYNDITQRSFTAEAFFVKQCGPDKLCEPDLSVKGQVRFGRDAPADHKELRVGTDNELTVGIALENKAQDSAYPGKVIVLYPSIMDYSGSNQGVSCSKITISRGFFGAKSSDDISKVECIVGNPFGKYAKKQFDIRFDTQRVTGNISELEISLEATSPGKDLNSSDNTVKLTVPVKFEADLSISGISRPDQVVYNDEVLKVKEITGIGPAVKNILTVRNSGPSPVEYTEVVVMVPFRNKSVEEPNYLLYLTDVQVLGNAGSCNIEVDPLDLQPKNISDSSTSSQKKPKPFVEPKNEEVPCESKSSITCLKVPCYLGRMKRGDQVQIQMAHRLWQNTLIKSKAGLIELTTTAEIVPSSSVPETKNDNNNIKITLTAGPKTTPTTKRKTAVWIYVVSAVGGLALLAIIALALFKCGFFKRKDLSPAHTEEEMTPMKAPAPEEGGVV